MNYYIVSAFLMAFAVFGVSELQAVEVVRNPAMVRAFKRDNPCPANGATRGVCPGYVVDHIVPLCAGGKDHPDNMQWQTYEAGRQKDRLEWWLCRQKKHACAA